MGSGAGYKEQGKDSPLSQVQSQQEIEIRVASTCYLGAEVTAFGGLTSRGLFYEVLQLSKAGTYGGNASPYRDLIQTSSHSV